MKRLLVGLAIALALLIPGTAAAWTNNSYSLTAENRLAYLIQREHLRWCKSRVYRNSPLNYVARWRARDMVVRNYFSHTIKGTTRRVFDYFYRWRIQWVYAGEIMAWNTYSDAESPNVAYRQFMGSYSHRKLIHTCRFRRLGVGAYKGGSKHMFVVVFTDPS